MTVGVCEDDFIFRSELLFFNRGNSLIQIIPSTLQRPHDGRARGRMSPCCRHAALPNLSNTKKHCNPKEPHLPVITFAYIYFYFMCLDVFLQVYVCTMYMQGLWRPEEGTALRPEMLWASCGCWEPVQGTRVLCKSNKAPNPDPSLQTPTVSTF